MPPNIFLNMKSGRPRPQAYTYITMSRIRPLVIATIALLSAGCVMIPTKHNKTITGTKTCDNSKPFPQMLKIPHMPQGWQLVHDCRRPRPADTSMALDIFYEEWEREFGDPHERVRKAINNLMVEWKGAPVPGGGYTINGTKVNIGRIKGLTLTKGYIWVYVDIGQRICLTSFVHELIHVALWATNQRHGDPDHEGPLYYGWTLRHSNFIQKVNYNLCRLNL